MRSKYIDIKKCHHLEPKVKLPFKLFKIISSNFYSLVLYLKTTFSI